MNIRLPILYSFRRCPYAIRTRMALYACAIRIELREVILQNKPPQLLDISPKATVPVLQLPDGSIIEESMDIIHWALRLNDALKLTPINRAASEITQQLVYENDYEFKPHLDRYKYADRYPDHPPSDYRQAGELFLQKLENRLSSQMFLISEKLSLADIAVFPFIRQFAFSDIAWFDNCPYVKLRLWLNRLLNSELFHSIMTKYPPWTPNQTVYFPDKRDDKDQ